MSANLASIRNLRRLTTAALSERLSQLGRPILANGITKIEKGSRRVDTDDLIALAIALRVTPNALLLPPIADNSEVQLTPAVTVSALEAWQWATGNTPLDVNVSEAGVFDLGYLSQFRRENRPHEPDESMTLDELGDNAAALLEVDQAIDRVQAATGLTRAKIIDYLEAIPAVRATMKEMRVLTEAGQRGPGHAPDSGEASNAE